MAVPGLPLADIGYISAISRLYLGQVFPSLIMSIFALLGAFLSPETGERLGCSSAFASCTAC